VARKKNALPYRSIWKDSERISGRVRYRYREGGSLIRRGSLASAANAVGALVAHTADCVSQASLRDARVTEIDGNRIVAGECETE
jgi:hypothetical protein